jgi:hypothetical protein
MHTNLLVLPSRKLAANILSVIIVLIPSTSLAAATPIPKAGQALEISPTVSELPVDPGKSFILPVKVHNISRDTQGVSGEVDDFQPSGETGLPKLDLSSDGSSQFSFKRWIGVLPTFQIVPREIKAINIKVNVPANASPGSHYGIIRFTASAPGLEGQGVSISTSIGILAIFNVSGKTSDKLSVKEFSVNQNGKTSNFFESAPLTFVERLTNTGNTDLLPQGNVELYDTFSHKTATVGVNQPPHIVLPGSTRRLENVLDSHTIGSKLLFGHYTARLMLTYGADNKRVLSATYSFWVIPYRLIITVIFSIMALIILLRFLSRRYSFSVQSKSKSGNKSRRK